MPDWHGQRENVVTPMHSCLSCSTRDVRVLVDFGSQPPSNRFERGEAAPCETHPLVVGQCGRCGLIQLINPMPYTQVKSHFEWLTYNEPEGHLDTLVDRLRQLPGIGSGSRIIGLTYKDDSTIARFNKLGHTNTYRVQAQADLGFTDACAGLESIQAAINASMVTKLAGKHGQADLLLVRHVLEHAHDPRAILSALKALVKPDGYLIFEMPDCAKFIKACDCTFVWEEHITYFNAQTLEACVAHSGLEMRETIIYPYPLEDSLIGIVNNAPSAVTRKKKQDAEETLLAEGIRFANQYAVSRTKLQSLFGVWQQAGKKVAIFGAGHLAAKFINLYSLEGLVHCVIDDNSHKKQLLMPGSRLAIRSSTELEAGGIDYCLLSLNPESEQKVRAKYQSYLDRGGRFLSIFASSPNSVYKTQEHESAKN